MSTYEKINNSLWVERLKFTGKRFLGFLSSTKILFYYCALISSWDDRSWYFLIGLYLVILDPSNLILAAIFGMLSSGLVLLLGSTIGSWIDKTSRLKAIYIVLIIRNSSTLICSICLCLVLFYYDDVIIYNKVPSIRTLAQATLVIFGVLAHMGGLVNNNILGKDWLPIFCLRDNLLLSAMSSRFRIIDMCSKIVAPVLIGGVITISGKATASIVFSVQVLITLAMFSFLLKVIYLRMPRLQYREHSQNGDDPLNENITPLLDQNKSEEPDIKEDSRSLIFKSFVLFSEGWRIYYKQPILFAGLALALLYMTVLGFDSITIGYALSQKITELNLSFFNAGAAITGIIGALIFPFVMKATNIVYTGILAIILQFICLIPCVLSVWAPGSPFHLYPESSKLINISIGNSTGQTTISTFIHNGLSISDILLMSGIISSRVGLWMFDLTVSQLLIETISETNRGKVNGVQCSLNMLLDMFKFVVVLIWPLPRQFGLLVLLSVGSVGIGTIFYLIFAISNNCKVSNML